MSADGNWKITINTPMGAQEVNASITTKRRQPVGQRQARRLRQRQHDRRSRL